MAKIRILRKPAVAAAVHVVGLAAVAAVNHFGSVTEISQLVTDHAAKDHTGISRAVSALSEINQGANVLLGTSREVNVPLVAISHVEIAHTATVRAVSVLLAISHAAIDLTVISQEASVLSVIVLALIARIVSAHVMKALRVIAQGAKEVLATVHTAISHAVIDLTVTSLVVISHSAIVRAVANLSVASHVPKAVKNRIVAGAREDIAKRVQLRYYDTANEKPIFLLT